MKFVQRNQLDAENVVIESCTKRELIEVILYNRLYNIIIILIVNIKNINFSL